MIAWGLALGAIWWGAVQCDRQDEKRRDAAVELAQLKVKASGYEEHEGSRACTIDCSGHEAGWSWARTHHIDSERQCEGQTATEAEASEPGSEGSASFSEGCKAFVNAMDGAETLGDDGGGRVSDTSGELPR